MRHLLILIILFFPFLSVCSDTKKSEPPMEEETTIVLGTESTMAQCLAESTTKMNRIINTLHIRVPNIRSNIELLLLVEDKKISIPTIKEASINFSFGEESDTDDIDERKFSTGTFNFLPTNAWLEAEGIKEQILQVRQLLEPIVALSLRTKEMDFNQLTDDYLKKVQAVGLNHYDLKDYNMALVLKQFPKEYAKRPIMREKEHFQIYLVIRNQHELDEWREEYKNSK